MRGAGPAGRLAATVQARDEETLHGAFNELLSRNTLDPAGERADLAADLAGGLAWSQSEVAPTSSTRPCPTSTVGSASALDPDSHAALAGALAQLSPDALGTILPVPPTRTLHLYAGSHIEAVPGTCRFPGIVTDALTAPTERDA